MPKAPTASQRRRGSSALPSPIDLPDASARLPSFRSASIWNSNDDEVLSSARASGLNWGPIASRYFPAKTANACRKRHERLMERRNQNDWENERLQALAVRYMEIRQEMWSVLAEKLGERWSIVEAKCMEQGLKNIQTIARSSHKRKSSEELTCDRGKEEHEDDSGVGLSDAEIDSGQKGSHSPALKNTNPNSRSQHSLPPEHQNQRTTRAPPLLPLYRPPPSATLGRPPFQKLASSTSVYHQRSQSTGPAYPSASFSIQSMLSPMG